MTPIEIHSLDPIALKQQQERRAQEGESESSFEPSVGPNEAIYFDLEPYAESFFKEVDENERLLRESDKMHSGVVLCTESQCDLEEDPYFLLGDVKSKALEKLMPQLPQKFQWRMMKEICQQPQIFGPGFSIFSL
jgi:hypothetical protein